MRGAILPLGLIATSAILATACRPSLPPDGPPRLVVAVRHAEKVDDSSDSDLSEEGYARARALASLLRDAGIERILSTDFLRTRETARPLANELGVPIELYDPTGLDELAAALRAPGGRALVVGHSNSTPELVRRLGGDPGTPIDEGEYDRVYVVITSRGETLTSLLRFSP